MELFGVRNRAWSSTGWANTKYEVIWCSGTGVINRGRSGASYTLGIKAMKNGWGKVTNGALRYTAVLGKSDRLTARGAACSSVGDHLVEAGLAKLARHVVRCVEGDNCGGVLEANEALLKAEM